MHIPLKQVVNCVRYETPEHHTVGYFFFKVTKMPFEACRTFIEVAYPYPLDDTKVSVTAKSGGHFLLYSKETKKIYTGTETILDMIGYRQINTDLKSHDGYLLYRESDDPTETLKKGQSIIFVPDVAQLI